MGDGRLDGAAAWIDGAQVAFDAAVAEAARRLRGSSAAAFSHLGADVEGAREAVLLADMIGATLDHGASDALLRDLDPVRESGAMLTTPLEAAVRADVVLLVGAGAAGDDSEWFSRPARPNEADVVRRVIWLDGAARDGVEAVETGGGSALLAFLASLRARVKRRPIANAPLGVEDLAAKLLQAKFGVAVWSAEALTPLAVEAIHGLARDLNETTRFSTLARAAPDNGLGVQTVCGWMTGFPLRTGFGRGRPEHDPWRFDTRRMLAADEADCQIWVSALSDAASPPAGVDIALHAARAPIAGTHVQFAVSRPGEDSDAILYDAGVGTLVATKASSPARAPTVAATLSAIRAALGGVAC